MALDTRRLRLLSIALPLLLSCSVTRVGTGPATSPSGAAPEPASGAAAACVTGDSLLDAPVMRELMGVLWDHSYADAPAEQRRERGGFLFDSLGVFVYRADLDHPGDTPCRSFAIVPRCGNPIAAVFTHPFRPGDRVPASCHPGEPSECRYTVERFGGASALDLEALNEWRVPGYIMDKEYVYAIPRGTTVQNALSLTRRYARFDRTAQCRII